MAAGGWGGTAAGSRSRGGGGDGAGRKRSWSDFDDDTGGRSRDVRGDSRGGRGGRSRGRGDWRGGGRGGSFQGGRGGRVGQDRPETKEEMWQRQRERQAVQVERTSWLQEQNERFPDSDYIFGVSPVLAALRTKRRVMYTLFIQETMDLEKRKDRGAVEEVEALAREMGCAVEYKDKGRLNVMSNDRPHQGLVLQCSRLEFVPLKSLDPVTVQQGQKPPLWLVLDEVMDPQNLGALLRSAYFLGCGGVVVCSKNSASLSAAVSKASAGAMEELPVHAATQLMKFLQASKDNGWKVIGAAMSDDSVKAGDVTLDGPTLLVMGNEGTGLRTLVLRLCDTVVQIEGGDVHRAEQNKHQGVGGDGGEVLDSLNVSVAGGILLHRLLFG